jgi:hypothetical protein
VWYGLGCHSELCGLERLRALAYASVAYSLDKINGPGLDGMWYGHGWMLAWTGLDWLWTWLAVWTGLDWTWLVVWFGLGWYACFGLDMDMNGFSPHHYYKHKHN